MHWPAERQLVVEEMRGCEVLGLSSGGWEIDCVFSEFFFFLIYFWLCWVFVAARGLSLVAASRGHSSPRCTDFLLQWLLLLWSTSSRQVGSVVVALRLSSCGSQALERRLSSCAARA